MLFAELKIGLPAAVPDHRRGDLVEWFRSVVGRKRAEETRRRLSTEALALFRGVIDAFTAAEIRNVVHVFVDDRLTYVDPLGSDDDLAAAFAKTMTHQTAADGFDELRMVCAHREHGLHVLFDSQIHQPKASPVERLHVRIAARSADLFIRRGESAGDYADRVRAFVRRPESLDELLESMESVVGRLSGAFAGALATATLREEPVRAKLIRTGTVQVGRFRNLGFRDRVRPPTYRAEPTHRRSGAYDSPFYYYYFDPYQDLLEWIAVDEMLGGRAWQSDRVSVVDRTGTLLFRGDDAIAHVQDDFEVPATAVRWTERGDLVVAEDIPRASSLDPIEIGSPYTPGYGGEGDG